MESELKNVDVLVSYSLDVECPYCEREYDLCDQDDDGVFTTPIFNNIWDELKG